MRSTRLKINNVASVSVLWNEAHRAGALLYKLIESFPQVVVVVQESSDTTLSIARSILRKTDTLVEDEWRGGGDFSMPLALSKVKQPWSFVISGDEYPSTVLLWSIPNALRTMERTGANGAFINFEETIDGISYVEWPAHVRLFRTGEEWAPRHHSGVSHDNKIFCTAGVIHHDRTLNEVVVDYLRKMKMMEDEGDTYLVSINKNVIKNACNLVADIKGMDYVESFEWWPEVKEKVML